MSRQWEQRIRPAIPAPRPELQRAALTPETQPDAAPPIVHEVLRAPGQALERSIRRLMADRFGYDLSGVRSTAVSSERLALVDPADRSERDAMALADQTARGSLQPQPAAGRTGSIDLRIHTGARAAASARAIGATAYTAGTHIVFGEGMYAPTTSAGQRLLAHELAHVAQQRGGQNPVVARDTRREIAHDDHLRDLARRPNIALDEWSRLSEGDRMVLVTYMTIYYSAEFATRFAQAARDRRRRAPVIHVTNVPDVTAETLARQGYRLAGRMGNTDLQIWVRPNGDEVWLLPQRTGSEQQAPPQLQPQTTAAADNPQQITIPSDPAAMYGPVRQTRENGVVLGTRGRVVRYADGTVEVYLAGSSGRYTYRPQPGGQGVYDFYDENGERTVTIGIDLDAVFSGDEH